MEIGTKSITFRHRLIRAEDGAVAFESIFKCVMLNLDTRRAEAIPSDVKDKAAAWLVKTE